MEVHHKNRAIKGESDCNIPGFSIIGLMLVGGRGCWSFTQLKSGGFAKGFGFPGAFFYALCYGAAPYGNPFHL